jgi:5-methylthioadenosine/S-adenosylhomocysteine deaminase
VGVDLSAATSAVADTVDYARSTMGEDAWRDSITPELPPAERIPNPYTYTEYAGSADRHTARP